MRARCAALCERRERGIRGGAGAGAPTCCGSGAASRSACRHAIALVRRCAARRLRCAARANASIFAFGSIESGRKQRFDVRGTGLADRCAWLVGRPQRPRVLSHLQWVDRLRGVFARRCAWRCIVLKVTWFFEPFGFVRILLTIRLAPPHYYNLKQRSPARMAVATAPRRRRRRMDCQARRARRHRHRARASGSAAAARAWGGRATRMGSAVEGTLSTRIRRARGGKGR